jgi:hypothetical protein
MNPYKTLLALFGAPAAWTVQMLLCESLTSFACYPHQAPLSAPQWANLPLILTIICVACLSFSLISGYVAWHLWQQTHRSIAEAGSSNQAIKVNGGQSQFLAMLGVMSSFIFIVAILFTSCAILLVPLCSEWT